MASVYARGVPQEANDVPEGLDLGLMVSDQPPS